METVPVEQKVLEIVTEGLQRDRGSITLETRFKEDLNADSLDQAKLVMEAEDEFDFAFSDDATDRIKTVGDAVEYIEEKLKTLRKN